MRENNVVLWAGEGYHLVHYPLRRGELFNIVASFGTATRALQGDDCQGEIRKYVQNAHPIVRSLFDLMDLQRSWIISDRDPIRHWSKGRVTLLGDAAHPALQSMAQGACMAIEDGVCLADRVELNRGDHAKAFQQYQGERSGARWRANAQAARGRGNSWMLVTSVRRFKAVKVGTDARRRHVRCR